MKSWEIEALCMKNERQEDVVITVNIEKNEDPNARVRDLGSFGGFGYLKTYGKMTERQRSKFFKHMENYLELLIKESEDEVEFRKKWDSFED